MVKPLKVSLLLAAIGSYVYKRSQNRQGIRQKAMEIIHQHKRHNIVDTSRDVNLDKVPVATNFNEIDKNQRPFYAYMYKNNPELDDQLAKALKKYNFGSCGPRGFLGTYTSHLLLERDLSFYYGQSTILFPSAASVLESILLTVNPDGVLTFNDDDTAFRLPEAFNVMKIDYEDLISGSISDQQMRTLVDLSSRGGGQEGGVSLWLVYDADRLDYDHGSILQACNRYGIRTCVKHNLMQPPEGFWRAYSTRTGVELNPRHFDLIITSLEQAFGCPGGVASGSLLYIGNARTTAPGYVYSAAQPPAICHVARVLMRQVINRHLDGVPGPENDSESEKIDKDASVSEHSSKNDEQSVERIESSENDGNKFDVKQVRERREEVLTLE